MLRWFCQKHFEDRQYCVYIANLGRDDLTELATATTKLTTDYTVEA
ncbi:hypothetical protein PN498_00775 [Oscillatoria sp. CS-180]|nr:hypothetical protein [Oscillatoria sp. CS-180]MDB9524506.1 hypothetical protein [Oscillatoria sp. CS-180]